MKQWADCRHRRFCTTDWKSKSCMTFTTRFKTPLLTLDVRNCLSTQRVTTNNLIKTSKHLTNLSGFLSYNSLATNIDLLSFPTSGKTNRIFSFPLNYSYIRRPLLRQKFLCKFDLISIRIFRAELTKVSCVSVAIASMSVLLRSFSRSSLNPREKHFFFSIHSSLLSYFICGMRIIQEQCNRIIPETLSAI